MIDRLLSFVAPHPCSGCSTEGSLLCHNCKYDIIDEPFFGCLACGRLAAPSRGLCLQCKVPYQRAWCVGERAESLQVLIEQYKFYRAIEGASCLAELLDAVLPELPASTRIVPIPTLPAHIRMRGYDHILLVARQLAALRNLRVEQPIERITTTKQLGASRLQRIKQAQKAFRATALADTDAPYLIIDDVVTTGSTVKFAAKALAGQGAKQIWVAAVSRQSIKN